MTTTRCREEPVSSEARDRVLKDLADLRLNVRFARKIDDVVLRKRDELPIRPFRQRDQEHAVGRRDRDHGRDRGIGLLHHPQESVLALFPFAHYTPPFGVTASSRSTSLRMTSAPARSMLPTRCHWMMP